MGPVIANERVHIYPATRENHACTRVRREHAGKLRPRSPSTPPRWQRPSRPPAHTSYTAKPSTRYSRPRYVGILNALHTVTCRRYRRHCSPLLPPSSPTRARPPAYPADRTSMLLSLSIPSAIFSLNKIITPGQLSVPHPPSPACLIVIRTLPTFGPCLGLPRAHVIRRNRVLTRVPGAPKSATTFFVSGDTSLDRVKRFRGISTGNDSRRIA